MDFPSLCPVSLSFTPCLPPSVVGSLPLHRLHPMTFCKHFIREPLVFSKALRQTDRAAVNRAGGTEGADQWKASLRTTMWLNFVQHRFNVYWMGWLWRVGDSCEAREMGECYGCAHTHTHFYAFHKVTVEKRRTALRACLAVVLRWRKERSDKMLRFSGEAERSGIHNQVHTGPTLIELKSVWHLFPWVLK